MKSQLEQQFAQEPPPFQGLTPGEVERLRKQGLGNATPVKTTRAYTQILWENVFTPINNMLFVLGLALVLLGKPSDALISIGVILVNTIISVVQEVRAKQMLDHIALLNRPKVTVVRSGQEVTVDPSEVVQGDLLRARAGDQIVVDGPVVLSEHMEVDESLLTGESDLVPKNGGDRVSSGSFCVTGGAYYQAEKVGQQSVAYTLTAGARTFRRIFTPLQRQINLTIRVVFCVAIFFELLMILANLTRDINAVQFVQMSIVIVGIVPQGLFLAITVAYALGAVRIAGNGALIQQANAVESMSHVDVVCLDKTGTLTANALSLADLVPLQASKKELQQLVADFIASSTTENGTSRAIHNAYAGQQHPFREEVPFSSLYKWSGLSFDEPTMHGTYVLGAVEMLEPALVQSADLSSRVAHASEQGLRVLLFASTEDVVALRDHEEKPTLPSHLLPLGLVLLRDQLRPEAEQTLAQFHQAGIQTKIISGDNPHTVAALARQAGVSSEIEVVSGLELAQMDAAQLAHAARSAMIFGRVTPQQKQQLVQALRNEGQYIAMIGDGVNDVLSLKTAQVAIAMQNGSQAARSVADIVLLNDSFASLPSALLEGRRIRAGMQDILKMFLTRVLYVSFLLITVLSVGSFPFVPKQISVLALFSVGLPSLALAAWSSVNTMNKEHVLRSLWRFVLPAALTIGLFSLLLYLGSFALHYLAALDNKAAEAQAEAIALASSQTVLTTFTMLCGLLLLLFIAPPSRFWVAVEPLRGDKRMPLLVVAMLLCYLLILLVPSLRVLFDLTALSIADYVVVLLVALVWVMILRWIWRKHLFERFLDLKIPEKE